MDSVVVLWTANTERFSDVISGLNDTKENLFAALERNEAEIAPSTIFGMACVHENVPFINGSPQNTVSRDVGKLVCSELKSWFAVKEEYLHGAETEGALGVALLWLGPWTASALV